MEFALAVKNIVIVGNFSPGNFDKYFFIKNLIVSENEIQENSQFFNELCILNTPMFNITIVVNQLVFTDLNGSYNLDNAIIVLKKLVSTSQFKCSAMGINFHWYLFSEEKTTELSKRLFYNENEKITKAFFNVDNVSYGLYLSKDFGNSRMKLDIKPATVTKIETSIEQKVLAFVFNFHVDLKNKDNTMIFKILDESSSYFNESKKIVEYNDI